MSPQTIHTSHILYHILLQTNKHGASTSLVTHSVPFGFSTFQAESWKEAGAGPRVGAIASAIEALAESFQVLRYIHIYASKRKPSILGHSAATLVLK